MALPKWLTKPAGWVARSYGRSYDYVTPGSGTSTLTNAGRAISDPNRVYTGSLTPKGLFNAATNTRDDFQPASTSVYQPVKDNPETARQQSPNSGAYGILGASTSMGGGSTNLLRDEILGRINSLHSAYDTLFGDVDRTIADQATRYGQDYDRQVNDLTRAFGRTQEQTTNAYGARGLQDSSYFKNAIDENQGIFDTNLDEINRNKENTLGELGRYASTTKSGMTAARNAFDPYVSNLGNYEDSDLLSLRDSVDQSISEANQQRAGLGTNAEFVSGLNKITPVANQGTAQLASRLQTLVTSSAPRFAKKQIARGLINASGLTDKQSQNYWQSYFEKLITSEG